MRLILHFFAIEEGKMCASNTGPPVTKSRLEEANTGVGGVQPSSSAHSRFLFMSVNHLFITLLVWDRKQVLIYLPCLLFNEMKCDCYRFQTVTELH